MTEYEHPYAAPNTLLPDPKPNTRLTPDEAKAVLAALSFGVPHPTPDLIASARAKLRRILEAET